MDAYCAQHPGEPERRTVQSINIHLAGLYVTVGRGLASDYARRVIGALTAGHAAAFRWLDPPPNLGTIRINHVRTAAGADDHGERVRAWARSVWDAWAHYHDDVARLVARVA
ncbi:hypothetical protein CKY28_13215 [Sphingomonas lenta]|uniref:Uncharacterized protein n=1 Tax=Sphingomonas lenta TaxID=1141887 RepID=A0A2A2SCT5_9SPHN|nr:hypothetical protein CKY28_13215 [Sphingomonas lenta]